MSFGRILNAIAGKFNTETYYDDVKLIVLIWKIFLKPLDFLGTKKARSKRFSFTNLN